MLLHQKKWLLKHLVHCFYFYPNKTFWWCEDDQAILKLYRPKSQKKSKNKFLLSATLNLENIWSIFKPFSGRNFFWWKSVFMFVLCLLLDVFLSTQTQATALWSNNVKYEGIRGSLSKEEMFSFSSCTFITIWSSNAVTDISVRSGMCCM